MVRVLQQADESAAIRIFTTGFPLNKHLKFSAATGSYLTSPLIYAIEHRLLQLAQWLIRTGAALQAEDTRGCTALAAAAQLGDLSLFTQLIAGGADITARDTAGNTLLHLAARSGSVEIVKYLVHQARVSIYVENHVRSRQTGKIPLQLAQAALLQTPSLQLLETTQQVTEFLWSLQQRQSKPRIRSNTHRRVTIKPQRLEASPRHRGYFLNSSTSARSCRGLTAHLQVSVRRPLQFARRLPGKTAM